MKKPSEIECLADDSESLTCDSQYDADARILNFLRTDDLETSDSGVSHLSCPLVDLFDLASEIGVTLQADFCRGLTADFAGIDSLLGGFAAFSLSFPESSRTLTLLLILEVLPLKKTSDNPMRKKKMRYNKDIKNDCTFVQLYNNR